MTRTRWFGQCIFTSLPLYILLLFITRERKVFLFCFTLMNSRRYTYSSYTIGTIYYKICFTHAFLTSKILFIRNDLGIGHLPFNLLQWVNLYDCEKFSHLKYFYFITFLQTILNLEPDYQTDVWSIAELRSS